MALVQQLRRMRSLSSTKCRYRDWVPQLEVRQISAPPRQCGRRRRATKVTKKCLDVAIPPLRMLDALSTLFAQPNTGAQRHNSSGKRRSAQPKILLIHHIGQVELLFSIAFHTVLQERDENTLLLLHVRRQLVHELLGK